MIESLKRIFTDDRYRGSLRLGPFYLIKGTRIPRPERFSPNSAEGQRARGITAADITEAGELEELNGQVGADENFAVILESRRKTRETYNAALAAQANRTARFGKKVKNLTEILGDEKAAMEQALDQLGYTIAACAPEPKNSPTAETLADLKKKTVWGSTKRETDFDPSPDLPPFLKKLT